MSKPVILISDSNAHIRCFLKREFIAKGFEVLAAKNHTEVLKYFEPVQKPDLVVLDPNIPFIGGALTLLRLLSKAPRTPVVIYTAYPEDAQSHLYEQAAAIVEKIPNPALLIQTIRNLLEYYEVTVPAAVIKSEARSDPGGSIEE